MNGFEIYFLLTKLNKHLKDSPVLILKVFNFPPLLRKKMLLILDLSSSSFFNCSISSSSYFLNCINFLGWISLFFSTLKKFNDLWSIIAVISSPVWHSLLFKGMMLIFKNIVYKPWILQEYFRIRTQFLLNISCRNYGAITSIFKNIFGRTAWAVNVYVKELFLENIFWRAHGTKYVFSIFLKG